MVASRSVKWQRLNIFNRRASLGCVLKPIPLLFVAAALLLAACGRFTGGDLDHNPDYIRARNAEAAGDVHVAATYYSQALRAVPDAGKAHLEFGVLCDEKLGDPVAALYHYRQFLELEPNSDRRQVVEGYIDRARLALAAKLPATNAADPAELMRLQAENAALRSRVTELERAATNTVTNASLPPPIAPVVMATNPASIPAQTFLA